MPTAIVSSAEGVLGDQDRGFVGFSPAGVSHDLFGSVEDTLRCFSPVWALEICVSGEPLTPCGG